MLPAISVNKAIHVKMEKPMFYEQMFSGPCRDNGMDSDLQALPCLTQMLLVIALSQ